MDDVILSIDLFDATFKKIALVLAILLLLIVTISKPLKKRMCVNVYGWYGVLPQAVIEQFEKETGIHVHYDVFDNNEMLEAKLLASNSGYDVVMPTVTPYGVRQLALKIYQRIDKRLLPNLGDVEPVLINKMKDLDPDMDFFMPYYWATTGLAFDEDRLKSVIPDVPLDDVHLLFDVDVLAKLKPYGVSLLQEPVDIFPLFLAYLGRDRDSRSLEDLWVVSQRLAVVSRYIRRFSSARFVTDLVFGDVCVAQAWSGEALRAIDDAKKIGRNIRYIIPKSGGDIWIDALAIPIGAPNVKNAHAFINFLLRPEISAQITNYSQMATMVVRAKSLVDKDLLENSLIFPTEETLETLHISPVFTGDAAEVYERVRTRLWAQIKMQRPLTRALFEEIARKQRVRVRKQKE
ncbi:MAG: extracellular solute-binding protein [Holosporales bacterium]|nr:extracellular solute-binding protein [Holosporales bacterium]